MYPDPEIRKYVYQPKIPKSKSHSKNPTPHSLSYLGRVDYFKMVPQDNAGKRQLLDNMLAMLFLASKFSVDDLFNSLMRW